MKLSPGWLHGPIVALGHGLHPEKDDKDDEQNENDDEDVETAGSLGTHNPRLNA
jgi:hypothetical protein